jgi:hypothetical protein
LPISEDVRPIGPAPEREYVRVFEEEQLLRSVAGAETLNRAFLDAKTVVVSDEA